MGLPTGGLQTKRHHFVTREIFQTALDFDGTVTDVEREAIPFVESYKKEVSEFLGLSKKVFEPVWQTIIAEIQTSPEKFGWIAPHSKYIVAPATADPLLLTRVATEQFLYRLREAPDKIALEPTPSLLAKLPKNADERHALLDAFFSRHYEKTDTCFREDVVPFFKEVASFSRVTIISNSSTTRMEKKLALLKEKYPDLPKMAIVGGAEKYILDLNWHLNGMPTTLDCSPELKRPVHTQRKQYYDTLKKSGLLEGNGGVVGGDVWELDLMLPQLLGLKIAFLTRDRTPEHEKKIVIKEAAKGHAKIANNLLELAAAIRELHQQPELAF